MIIGKPWVDDLIEAAKQGMLNAFTGNSDKEAPRFGAAVLTKSGFIFSAGQYFSDTLSLTLHAEQAAIAHAAAHGEYEIKAVTCVGNRAAYQISGGKIYPCHLCKQILWESYLRSGLNSEILIVDANYIVIETYQLVEVMSHNWPQKFPR